MAVQTARSSAVPPSSRARRQARREWLTAYLFVAPYLIIALVFTVGLLLYAFYTSFTNRNSILQEEAQIQFAGLTNYVRAFSNPDFRLSLINIFWYSLFVTLLQTVGAILLAVALNAPMRAQRLYRTIFYAPSVTSSVVISMIFLWLYIRTGFINYFLGTDIAWLQDSRGLFQMLLQPLGININSYFLRGPSVTWMSIMALNIYTTIPTFMLMFLAALQDIPKHLYEAASIDGAGKLRQFFSITLPLLRPTIVLVLVLSTIGTAQVFDQVAVMTSGGPAKTTLTPVYFIYTKTLGTETSSDVALANAMAFILAGIIFVLTFIQRRFIEQGSERV